ncbi:DUF1329 domain-containing protein [Paraburkholderia sp. SIMBA_030]|uniref:DUF1329 domain-containing protein n=1 Tax=Paraburkholderia sp. SIMBA_030 TaxID=3085773 RepID=UPI0039787EDF
MEAKRCINVRLILAVAVASTVALVAIASNAESTGIDKSASPDGRIPAYSGSQPPASGWTYGKVRGDYWKHKGESPLFSINASNVDKYAANLTPGQVQLIKQRNGYRMDVFPTHRECGAPDFVQANSEKNGKHPAMSP